MGKTFSACKSDEGLPAYSVLYPKKKEVKKRSKGKSKTKSGKKRSKGKSKKKICGWAKITTLDGETKEIGCCCNTDASIPTGFTTRINNVTHRECDNGCQFSLENIGFRKKVSFLPKSA